LNNFFSGEHGSGKSDVAKLILRQISFLVRTSTENPTETSQLLNDIRSSLTILEAFGNAKTKTNPNSSRVGKCLELQFSSKGSILGSKLIDYQLEKARVSGSIGDADEGVFHIFNYLFNGLTAKEKSEMKITDPSKFIYMNLHKQKSSDKDKSLEKERFEELKASMRQIGLSKKVQVSNDFLL